MMLKQNPVPEWYRAECVTNIILRLLPFDERFLR